MPLRCAIPTISRYRLLDPDRTGYRTIDKLYPYEYTRITPRPVLTVPLCPLTEVIYQARSRSYPGGREAESTRYRRIRDPLLQPSRYLYLNLIYTILEVVRRETTLLVGRDRTRTFSKLLIAITPKLHHGSEPAGGLQRSRADILPRSPPPRSVVRAPADSDLRWWRRHSDNVLGGMYLHRSCVLNSRLTDIHQLRGLGLCNVHQVVGHTDIINSCRSAARPRSRSSRHRPPRPESRRPHKPRRHRAIPSAGRCSPNRSRDKHPAIDSRSV